MHRHLARISVIVVMLLLVGCSGSGPTVPGASSDQTPDGSSGDLTETALTPQDEGTEGRILGNFVYVSDKQETLAWGTLLSAEDGWDCRLDYVAPKIRALRRSEVTRQAQSVIDLTWLGLLYVGVSYYNKPLPLPGEFATYEPGELMKYRVDIQNNTRKPLQGQTVAATHVDMFNQKLDEDAQMVWNDVEIPSWGLTLIDDWVVNPELEDGIYFTRVRIGFEAYGGTVTILLFNYWAGRFKVEAAGGPEYYDPIAKGVTTTPVVAVGENVHVQDNGSFDPDGGSIVLYEWDFENDGTFDATGPEADTSYDEPGVYYINLRVTDDEGATDDLTDDPGDALIEVTVTPPPVDPVAIAWASKYEAYVGEVITFHGEDSYDPDGGDIVLHEWDLDGVPGYDKIGATVDYSYGAPGVYDVQLRVTDDELQTDTLDEPLKITILEQPQQPPVACAEWRTDNPDGPVPCDPITFDASCSEDPDGEIVLYAWDLYGTGSYIYTTTMPEFVHSYEEPGEYEVQLEVTDDDGLKDTLDEALHVVVENALPTAVGEPIQITVTVGEPVEFDGSDSYDNDCGGQSIVLWSWDWTNDGEYDESFDQPLASHVYYEPGQYEVMLMVEDDEGGTDELDEPLKVFATTEPLPPVACAIWSVPGNPDGPVPCDIVEFDASCSEDFDGEIVLYEWDFDGDGSYDDYSSDQPFAEWVYYEPGEYEVDLKVTDNEGFQDTLDEKLLIVVENALPTAYAEPFQISATVGEPIDFNGSGSHDNDCDGQSIVLWSWDWTNDGEYDESFDQPLASHAYYEPGQYEVMLMVEDDEGGTDELDQPLLVFVVAGLIPPVACAEWEVLGNPEGPVPCDPIQFDASCSQDEDGEITLYEWDFDFDGSFEQDDVGLIVVHDFTALGEHPVQLRVTDNDGLQDLLDSPIVIVVENALPTAVGDPIQITVTIDEPITFSGAESYDNDCNGESIVYWEWDWTNDGEFDEGFDQPEAEHSYSLPGVYRVQLQVTDDEGGKETLDDPLTVIVTGEPQYPPVACAEWEVLGNPEGPIPCDVIRFDGSCSEDSDGEIVLYEWDFNYDGSFNQDDVGMIVTHPYETDGEFQVQLRVTDNDGLQDLLDEELLIVVENALPTAIASADKYEAGIGEIITFDGSESRDNDCDGQEIEWWEWDWENDGGFDPPSDQPMAPHAYDEPGVYEVQLRVTDDEGGTAVLAEPLIITVSLDCPVGVHTYALNRGIAEGYSIFTYSMLPRADIAFIEQGDFAGHAIVQGGENSLVKFDPDVDLDDPIDDWLYTYPTGAIMGTCLVTSLDAAPYEDMVAEVTSDKPSEVKLIDTSVLAGPVVEYTYDFGTEARIMAVDFAQNGDIYLVVKNEPTAGNIFLWTAQYIGAPEYYEGWTYSGIGGDIGLDTDVFDIAVNWSNGLLYLFEAGFNGTGRVVMYDTEQAGLPGVGTAEDVFGSPIVFEAREQYGVAGFADIEIDHMVDNEICHIVLYARLFYNEDTGEALCEVQKRDAVMSLISKSAGEAGWPSMTINPEPDVRDRDLLMPAEGNIGFWFAPIDW